MRQLQAQCQRCPLHKNGPLPVAIPLAVDTAVPVPLVVIDRPLGNAFSPEVDARFRALKRLVPEVSDFAVTYVANCWSQPGKAVPERSLEACTFHRRVELAILRPPLIISIGAQACRLYLGAEASACNGQAWLHATGATVFVLEDSLAPLHPEAVELLTLYCRQAREAMAYDFV